MMKLPKTVAVAVTLTLSALLFSKAARADELEGETGSRVSTTATLSQPSTGASSKLVAPQTETVEEWYGGSILLLDVVAVGMVGGGALVASSGDHRGEFMSGNIAAGAGIALVGAGIYVLGGPIVHASHGHGGKAAGSLGLRLGMPVVLAPVANGAGAVAGILGAMAIDDGILAREEVKRPVQVSVLPTVDIQNKGAGFSASGTF